MRGILINPIARNVSVIDVVPGLEGTYAALRSGDPAFSGTIDGIEVSDHDTMFVDDEGFLTEGRAVFQIGAAHKPIAGSAVILAHDDEGETIASDIPLEVVQAAITWTDLESTGDFGPSREYVMDHPTLGPNTPVFEGGAPILRTREGSPDA